jgi:RIO kinase 1
LARLSTEELLQEDFDLLFDRRGRNREANRLHRARQEQFNDHAVTDEILAHVEDTETAASAFNPTFKSSKYERVWILNYLGPFYEKQLIADVLRKVKGGKEATVYCCQAGAHAPSGGLIAAKVYRPRQFRNQRNDSLYRQGREVLGARGQPVRDRRALLAIKMGTRKGKEMEHVSWLAHEYATLQALQQVGVRVPQPISFANNTILMEYVGTLRAPAPVLHSVTLDRDEARDLFNTLMADVERMLAAGHVHADLSAFNVLYLGDGDYRIIDFPQAVDAAVHPSAPLLFERDVTRLCQYFARYGLAAHGPRLAAKIWERSAPMRLVGLDAEADVTEEGPM